MSVTVLLIVSVPALTLGVALALVADFRRRLLREGEREPQSGLQFDVARSLQASVRRPAKAFALRRRERESP